MNDMCTEINIHTPKPCLKNNQITFGQNTILVCWSLKGSNEKKGRRPGHPELEPETELAVIIVPALAFSFRTTMYSGTSTVYHEPEGPNKAFMTTVIGTVLNDEPAPGTQMLDSGLENHISIPRAGIQAVHNNPRGAEEIRRYFVTES
ncbi:hypothetical protein FVEN_g6550 [Fusarium venenatum]|nr:hypothetical protein FVEN_g6550 [Fusarium venenatum]